MNHLIIAPIIVPLIAAAILLVVRWPAPAVRAISLASASVQLVVAGALFARAASGAVEVYALGNWAAPFGIVLVLDRLSALMLITTAVLAFFSIAYSLGSRSQTATDENLQGVIQFLLMGINGAFLTGDLFNLFVFFEVLLMASYALLLHGGGAARIKAGLHYVLLNLAGSSLFLIAAALLYAATGTLNMADLAQKVATLSPADTPLVHAAALLLLVVFGLKAAMVPLYFWLPRAYAAAAAPVAALFAIMTKIGLYAIIRVYTLIFGDSAGELANIALPWLWPLALTTVALGAIGALAARELRLQIAYLVIVSVGTLLAGVAMHNRAALSATAYYVVHSTWICAALFLLADIIARQRGAAADRIIPGPAMAQAILLGGLFFFAAISVIGLPPLSGFIGKVMLLEAAHTHEQVFWLWLTLLSASFVMLIALSRSGSTLFWRTEKRTAKADKPSGWGMSAAICLLATSLLLSLAGQPAMRYTHALAQQLLTPAIYVDSVLQHPVLSGETHAQP